MKDQFRNIVLVLACVCVTFGLYASVELKWGAPFDLPPFDGHPNVGVARPFAGVSGGRVLLAGGANFPHKPLIAGGPKVYHDEIWSCDIAAEKPAGPLPATSTSVSATTGICFAGSV